MGLSTFGISVKLESTQQLLASGPIHTQRGLRRTRSLVGLGNVVGPGSMFLDGCLYNRVRCNSLGGRRRDWICVVFIVTSQGSTRL
jgi:hypothetical protein